MDERQIGLALTMNELGLSRDVSGFPLRLILQKAIYLVEEAGIRLGYPFSWYLRGPYSPALTRDLFELATHKEDLAGWVLDEQSRAIARRIKPLVTTTSHEDQADTVRRLELLASLHYLSRRRRVDLDNLEETTKQLAQNGKHFTSDQVATALERLRQAELL